MSIEKDSLIYQYLYEHGALKGVGRFLLRQGEIKFGAPTEKAKAAIKEEEDLERLIRMVCVYSPQLPGTRFWTRLEPPH